MITTNHLFSVRVGQTSLTPDLNDYLDRLTKVRQGVINLLKPIGLHNHLRMQKRVCQEGLEWLDIGLSTGSQLTFLNDLEESLGSNLTELDIECQIARNHTHQILQRLRDLHLRKIWQAADFLDKVYPRDNASKVANIGRQMDSGDGSVQIQFAQGQTATANVPNRRFSAMHGEPVQLLCRPDQVGLNSAVLRLSKNAQHRIGASCRRIEATWHDPFSYEMSERIYTAAKKQSWITARCRVVVNGSGKPKGLLIETISP